MDLNTVQATTRTIEITHPATGDNIGLRIEVRPEHDKAVKAAQRKNLDEQLNSRKNKMTAVQIDKNNMRLNVASVASWEWYHAEGQEEAAQFKGEVPECTPDNVEEVFKAVPWIRDQVRAEFDDAIAFFEA